MSSNQDKEKAKQAEEKQDKNTNFDKKDHNDGKEKATDPNVLDPNKKGTGLGLTSRSGAETELGTDPDVHDTAEGGTDPTVRLKSKEDLRKGLNNSNPNNQFNNSNSLLDNE